MGDREDVVVGSACPECGHDVSVLEDVKRKWTHRSRVLPRIGWVVLCLGLIGYLVWGGQYHSYQQLASENRTQQVTAGWWNQASFTPADVGMTNSDEASYFSTRDLRDAIDGDEDALGRIALKIGEAGAHNREAAINTFGPVGHVKFGWREPYGSKGSRQDYRFGGMLFTMGEDIMLQDIRDDESVGHDSYHWSWGEGGWDFWPRIGYKEISQADELYLNGAVRRGWAVDLVGVFGLVSMCLVGAWVIGLVLGVVGVSKIKWRRLRYGLFALLLVSAGVVSLVDVDRTNYRMGENSQGGTLTEAFSVDDLDTVVADELALIAFCEQLLELVPSDERDEMLLAQAWEFVPGDKAEVRARPSYRRVYVSVGSRFGSPLGNTLAWIQFERRVFEDVDGAYVERSPMGRSRWEQFSQRGTIDIGWGPVEKQSGLSLSVFGWVSIGVMIWMIWAVLHWVARIVFRRVQKRRVGRNECVFCAYPLTQAGSQARYPEVES